VAERTYDSDVAAERAGVSPAEIEHLTEIGILDAADGYTDAHVRRIHIVRALERAGLPVDAVGALIREGRFSLAFIDEAGFGVFAALGDATFADVAERTGIPVEHLVTLREITGGARANPSDRMREDELEIVPLVEFQLELGFRWSAVARALRVYADSLRRIAEGEAEWWRSEIQEPLLASGASAGTLAGQAGDVSPRLSRASDRAVMAIYHAQQMQVWSVNIVNGIAAGLEQAGVHTRAEVDPAMAFLDVTGYTQLTQERGDAAAADLVERMGRIVQPIAVSGGGRPVKWLGDGVMFHFPDPSTSVPAALDMIDGLVAADLPPAHVGIHAGPVIIQEGDYYGATVNLASRIGEYARPGEVLVSQAVAEASASDRLSFGPVGSVSLKGISAPVELFAASRAAP
jgi:class 3 adenylate cyclase